MDCDICSKRINLNDFYILTTTQVVLSRDYWKYLLEQSESKSPGYFKEHPLRFLALATALAGSQSNWCVCPDCINHVYNPFQYDEKRRARKYAEDHTKGREVSIPESGKADADNVLLLPISLAWQDVYGLDFTELLKKADSDANEGINDIPRSMVYSEEIGTQRANFWKRFKKLLGM